jgi:hypothetical protein
VTHTRTRRCMWLLSGRVWSIHHACGHLIKRFALQGMGWTTELLPPYESRYFLLGLEVLSDRIKIAAALFVRKMLCRRIESTYFTDLLRFESNPYPKRRNARLMDFYHRTNYGQNDPVNKEILIFNEYCELFGFRNGISRALSEERSHLL